MREYEAHTSAFFALLTSCESCERREFDRIVHDTFVCDGCDLTVTHT
jgi:ribosomal protein L37AE/L43A